MLVWNVSAHPGTFSSCWESFPPAWLESTYAQWKREEIKSQLNSKTETGHHTSLSQKKQPNGSQLVLACTVLANCFTVTSSPHSQSTSLCPLPCTFSYKFGSVQSAYSQMQSKYPSSYHRIRILVENTFMPVSPGNKRLWFSHPASAQHGYF